MEHLTKQQQECIAFAQQPKAGGAVWKDCTLHSTSDEIKIPRMFETFFADVRITINCQHPQHIGKWVMTCILLGFAPTVLTATSVTGAAEQSVEICRQMALNIADAFRKPEPRKGWFECVCNLLLNNKKKN